MLAVAISSRSTVSLLFYHYFPCDLRNVKPFQGKTANEITQEDLWKTTATHTITSPATTSSTHGSTTISTIASTAASTCTGW